jgi:hypothetical protein
METRRVKKRHGRWGKKSSVKHLTDVATFKYKFRIFNIFIYG